MEIWNKFNKPPVSALKQIQGGRLSGKSDINPQWRYQAMTEVFGICGIGWKYEIIRLWTEQATENQIFAFAEIRLYVKQEDVWSEAIPATGGSMLIQKERSGLHSNDEGYKMAVTDALGTAMKMLGVAAEIYLGNFDGSKYRENAIPGTAQKNQNLKSEPNFSAFDVCYAALQNAANLQGLKRVWGTVSLTPAFLSLSEEEKEKIRNIKDSKKEEFILAEEGTK